MAQKVIAVIGATGAQGGGLVSAILKDGAFAVRALTRDPSKPSATVSASGRRKASLPAFGSGRTSRGSWMVLVSSGVVGHTAHLPMVMPASLVRASISTNLACCVHS
eukprot:365202-Chlamydomonas_euryale.AAC.11